MNALYYRVAIIGRGTGPGGSLGATLVAFGYKADNGIQTVGDFTNTNTITGLNDAVSQAMAFVRRFQAMGLNCRGEIYGRVFDTHIIEDRTASGLPDDGKQRPITATGTSNAIRDLAPGEGNEQVYCRVDTPPLGLRVRINDSNRAANTSKYGSTLGGSLNTDTEDVANP